MFLHLTWLHNEKSHAQVEKTVLINPELHQNCLKYLFQKLKSLLPLVNFITTAFSFAAEMCQDICCCKITTCMETFRIELEHRWLIDKHMSVSAFPLLFVWKQDCNPPWGRSSRSTGCASPRDTVGWWCPGCGLRWQLMEPRTLSSGWCTVWFLPLLRAS